MLFRSLNIFSVANGIIGARIFVNFSKTCLSVFLTASSLSLNLSREFRTYQVDKSSMYFLIAVHAFIVLYFSRFSWTSVFSFSVSEIIHLSIIFFDAL